jgi:ribonuclease BN (tRNA processing enzyme)
MEVVFLGTGAPLTSRATTGMLITAGGCEPLLVDTCGGFELSRNLESAGFSLGQIRNVVVTHRHFDHTGGMMALFMANLPLNIHALEDTHEGIREMKAGSIPDWDLHPAISHRHLVDGEARDIGGFAVECFHVVHRVPTVAVRISYAGKTIGFSGDSLPCPGLVAAARDADLFICDSMCAEMDGENARTRARGLMHPTAKQAAEISQRAGAHRLACVHIARFGSVRNVKEEAGSVFKGPLLVPNDGDRYAV